MARPAGISMTVETILRQEAIRLQQRSEKEGLDDLELSRLQKLLAISQLLVMPSRVSEFPDGDLDSMVDELKQPRDGTLFPKKGPKSTAKIHNSEE